MVEENEVRSGRCNYAFDLLQLALSHQRRGIRPCTPLDQRRRNLRPSTASELFKLGQGRIPVQVRGSMWLTAKIFRPAIRPTPSRPQLAAAPRAIRAAEVSFSPLPGKLHRNQDGAFGLRSVRDALQLTAS